MSDLISKFLLLAKEAIILVPILIFGSTGETLTEKSGHLNMGTPGILCMGAAGGMIGLNIYNGICGGVEASNPALCFIFSFLFALLLGAFSGFIFSLFTVTLRCNQNVMGLAYTTFGIGFFGLMLKVFPMTIYDYNSYCVTFNTLFMKPAECTNAFEEIFLSHGLLFYLSFAVALGVAAFLRWTRIGLFIRSVGESASSSDAAGIDVSKYRYIVTIIGSAITALGGLYFFLEVNCGLVQINGTLDGYGWLAVALVIFTLWKTDLGIVGAIVFALLFKLSSVIELPADMGHYKILMQYVPYLATILILIITSIIDKKSGRAPADLGIAYFREER